jgi:hypothetical protein
VLAWDEATGATGSYTVTDTISHIDPVVLELTINGERLQTTAQHPFYTLGYGSVDAGNLWLGAQVRRADGSTGVVQGAVFDARSQPMYNLTVATAHTFFVGDAQWLVHNCGGTTTKPQWPDNPDAMDDMLGIKGERIPDGSATPGRSKVTWQTSDNVKITYEQLHIIRAHQIGIKGHIGKHW